MNKELQEAIDRLRRAGDSGLWTSLQEQDIETLITHAERAAHVITGNAIRDKRLIKCPCEVCGIKKVEAHHDDYNFPMKVRWLCKQHHADHHKQERERARDN